jgi:hypothetical protein
MRRNSEKDKKLADDERLLCAWRAWHAEELTKALAGPHRHVLEPLMQLLKNCRRQPCRRNPRQEKIRHRTEDGGDDLPAQRRLLEPEDANMSARERLPNRGRLAEIFVSNAKVGSHSDAAAKDAAVVCSIGLQHGVPLETIRHALLRDAQGRASSPLGAALDAVAGEERT